MIPIRTVVGLGPLVLKQTWRRPARTALTVLGIAIAMFLFVAVGAMREGVRAATEVSASDATLVVFRENRFCPFTSRLPQFYGDRIERIEGVASVVPMRIVVSNCRASLEVVTFRGVPEDAIERSLAGGARIIDGSFEEWSRRGDAALVGEALAARRGIRVGDRFSAAGITVYVAGILASDEPQDRNVAYVPLAFIQEAVTRGGTGGIVTQFNVHVDDPRRLDEVAASIDAAFAYDEHPTATRPEKAFIGRAARDIVELVRFAGWIGWGAIAAVFALLANAMILAMRDRIRDHAVFQTVGFTGGLVGLMVVAEGLLLGAVGGGLGAVAAFVVVRLGRFTMTMEGVNLEVSTDPRLAALGLAVAVGLGLLAGLVPAIRAGRRDIASCFRAV